MRMKTETMKMANGGAVDKMKKKVKDTLKKLKPRPGLISQTFTSSTGAIEASKIIISELVNNNYLGKI